jgi:two-component system, OmpR family, sensor kinase
MWCDRRMRKLARTLARLPIRLRLALAFTAVLALVLLAAGVFLAREFERDLDRSIDEAQRAQAQDIVALVEAARRPAAVLESGERYVGVYAAGGRLLASSQRARRSRLLHAGEVRAAARMPLTVERRSINGIPVRLLAVPATPQSGRRAVVVVGDSLRLRDSSLTALNRVLLIALPVALLVAAFAGYEVAGAALRPVGRMRSRAATISESNPSERLPLPEARDEIAALGNTLNEMLARLEGALARERRLVSDASHELRTPLTTLRAELELALRGERDAAELRAAIASAHEEARRMSTLADDLLVLARADQGRLPLRTEPCVAADLLEAAVRRAHASFARAGRPIAVRPAGSSAPVVLADPGRIAQALDNLIANSLHHGDGPVELAVEKAGRAVELHVMDRGAGFGDDFLTHAFERFRRDVRGGDESQGAGLGLAIVEAVARAHGGAVAARNRTDGGADVWLTLPEA